MNASGAAALFLVIALAGCMEGGTADPLACGQGIETVSPSGYGSGGEGPMNSHLPLRAGDTLTVRAVVGRCPMPASFTWVVSDTFTKTGFANDFGGFGPRQFESMNATVSLDLPHVGTYWVEVYFRANDGALSSYPAGAVIVYAYHDVEGTIPSDEASFSSNFSSFCCPHIEALRYIQASSGLPRDWIATVSVESTGQQIWRGRPLEWTGNEFQEALGYQWLEVINFTADSGDVPPSSPMLAAAYDVEMRVGMALPIDAS